MRRLFILIALLLMIVFNGIAFNVLADSHAHNDGDKHDKVTTSSDNVKNNPEEEGHGNMEPMDDM